MGGVWLGKEMCVYVCQRGATDSPLILSLMGGYHYPEEEIENFLLKGSQITREISLLWERDNVIHA